MGRKENISPELAAWIEQQPVFFVASAPLADDGHINVSPRGLDSFRVLGPDRVIWLDLTGSGNETAAHLAENGRITIMFCAFTGPPKILRLFGKGQVVLPDSESWTEMRAHFPAQLPGVRQIMSVRVSRVATSCGFGVPQMQLLAPRKDLTDWAERKGENGLAEYRDRKNSRSIDGLPAPGWPKMD